MVGGWLAGYEKDRFWRGAIFLVILLAAFVRLYRLADASLWLDEVETIRISELPFSVLWVTAYDPTPPLFYTIEKLVLQFGQSAFLIRLPSAIFGVLTIYVMYRAASEVGGYMAGISTAIILTLSSGNIEYSQEARAYALLGLCISTAFLGLIRLYIFPDVREERFSSREFLKMARLCTQLQRQPRSIHIIWPSFLLQLPRFSRSGSGSSRQNEAGCLLLTGLF